MNTAYYPIIIIISIYIVAIIYTKVKYPFWSFQPVFHYYNLLYWLRPPGVINYELPQLNKFCNFTNIKTYTYNEVKDFDKQAIVNCLQNYFLRTSCTNYLPSMNSFDSCFLNHKYDSYISLYYEPKTLFNYSDGSIINNKEIIGTITSRPLYVSLYNINFCAYYIDYLCVNPLYRKKNIAPQLIQTHEFNQRRLNKDIIISLFKREGDLNGIVPLTYYKTYAFKKISISKMTEPTCSVILITPQTLFKVIDFIKLTSNKFSLKITPNMPNLIELIKNKVVFIYALKSYDNIIACYIFKNTFTTYNRKKSVELIASINNCHYDEIFYRGFTNAYYNVHKLLKCKMILIEDISHNTVLFKYLLKYSENSKYIIGESKTAFYLYNYAIHSIESNKSLIIY